MFSQTLDPVFNSLIHVYPKSYHEIKIPLSWYNPNQEMILAYSREKITYDDPFTYKINEYGFRFDTNLDSNKKTICFVGCSITFGIGTSEKQTIANIFTKLLGPSWQYINVAMPASSIDVQAINLAWTLQKFKIDMIFWLMPKSDRFLYTDNKRTSIIPIVVQPPFVESQIKNHKCIYDFCNCFEKTINNDQINWVIASLCYLKIPKLIGSWDYKTHQDIAYKIKCLALNNVMLLPKHESYDKGRDGKHFGPKTNEIFAKESFEKLKQSNIKI